MTKRDVLLTGERESSDSPAERNGVVEHVSSRAWLDRAMDTRERATPDLIHSSSSRASTELVGTAFLKNACGYYPCSIL